MLRISAACVVLTSVVAACDSARLPASPSAVAVSSEPQRIAVIGDSLAVSPSKEESFPSVLQARIDARQLAWSVVNAGVRGDTTSGGRRRLESVLAVNPRVLIIALGANDGLRGVDVDTIERNLAAIIERAQSQGVEVVLCGMETPPLNGWNYTVAFHRIYPALAEKYGLPLVPFLLTNVALNPEMNGPDLVHPNAAGARQIAETVWPYLLPLIEPSSHNQRRLVG